MQHYSPSSDDSPVDHRHNIRLSDFRHVSPRGHSAPPAPLDFSNPVGGPAFARAENKRGLDALSVIHGSQSGLRTSIQQERHKISSVTEEVQSNNSALFQSPRRRPPKAPNAINVKFSCLLVIPKCLDIVSKSTFLLVWITGSFWSWCAIRTRRLFICSQHCNHRQCKVTHSLFA